ncbi:MAG: hypothetical protein QXZ70_05385 [Candidatus Bathyarchaeia archaeon]
MKSIEVIETLTRLGLSVNQAKIYAMIDENVNFLFNQVFAILRMDDCYMVERMRHLSSRGRWEL